jgi:hypothetical protein
MDKALYNAGRIKSEQSNRCDRGEIYKQNSQDMTFDDDINEIYTGGNK